jgi:Lon protease-like protein
MVDTMAMFPLGSVLLPGMALPLHVFEPRYRALVDHCLEDRNEPEFGVVLIERGSEVGGGDARTTVGTVARIVEATRFDDGRWAIGAVGVRRIRVVRWLPDDPFPRAETEDWPDAPGEPSADRLAEVVPVFRRVLALASELEIPVPPATVELIDDAPTAVLQMALGAPLGPSDRHDLLAAAGPVERLELLAGMLDDQAEMLAGRAAMDDPGSGLDDGFGEEPGGL